VGELEDEPQDFAFVECEGLDGVGKEGGVLAVGGDDLDDGAVEQGSEMENPVGPSGLAGEHVPFEFEGRVGVGVFRVGGQGGVAGDAAGAFSAVGARDPGDDAADVEDELDGDVAGGFAGFAALGNDEGLM
jgi:hypothetical protein